MRSPAITLTVLCLAMPATASAGLIEEAGSPVGVGVNPWWTAAADFNGDGLPDLAVANDESASASGTVSILLRQPLGGFVAEGAPITVGARPDSLVAADLNGDGRQDLAVGNYVSSTVTVLLRKADNTGFDEEAGSPIAVGTSPHAVAAGDFNGDGRIDLATPSHALSTVSVLVRKTDNTGFEEEAASPVAVGTNPTQLALADFDADGRLDIAAANRGSDDVTVLLRRTDNTGFDAESGTPPAAGDGPVGIATADFDGDGRPDLAVAGETSDDVTVLLRQAAGGFQAAPGSPHPAGDGAYGLTSADFNQDGRPDLAATAFAANRVSILHGTGAGDFQEAPFSPLPTPKSPLVPASADFDADGAPDLAIPSYAANTVTVRLNRPDAAAPAPATVPAGCSPPSAGRVGLWRGEDSARDSAGDHDGTLENGATYRNGIVGRAFSLAGSDDYLHVPGRPDLNVSGDVSFDTWVQIDDANFGATDPYGVGGDRVIAWKTNANDSELTFAFWIEGDSPRTAAAAPLAFASGPRSDSSTFVNSGDLAWQPGTWYHVAVVRNGSSVGFYRDGQPVGSATIGGAPASTPAEPVALGAGPFDATVFNPLLGGIDEAGLWSRALSAGEVNAIYETATGACFEPDTTLTSTPPALTNDPTPTFEFSSPDPGTSFQCELDSGGYTACSSPHTTEPLADGGHVFAVRAVSIAGRRGPLPFERDVDPEPARFEFEVDTTAPETTITDGPADGSAVTGRPAFAFESSTPGSTFRCFRTSSPGTLLARTTFFDCASPAQLDLAAGNWEFGVWAIDQAGNADASPAQRAFSVVAPPVNTARPSVVNTSICPTGVGGGGCRPDPNSYRCDPGTWQGRDEGRYYGFAWYRMAKDPGNAEGYSRGGKPPVAYGEYFTASSETQLGMSAERWVFSCAVEAYNAAGTGTAYSPPRQLSPKHDPAGAEFDYGDFSIRGIDVFQVVQPNAGARAFGWDPARDSKDNPIRDAGGADLAFGFDMAGAGTPTAYKRTASGGGRLPADTDPQRVPYEGVTLDADKPTVAVVYASRKDPAPSNAPSYPVRITLTAKYNGRPYDSPITRDVRYLFRADTPFVTAQERDDLNSGVQFQIPGTWLVGAQSGRLDLEAKIELVQGFGFEQVRQCPGETPCTADDRFVLQGVPARSLPAVDIMGVRLAKTRGEAGLDLDDRQLQRARELLPGGQNLRAFTTAGEVFIGDILSSSEVQVGQPRCEKWKDVKDPLRWCRAGLIEERLLEWESTQKQFRPLYDMVLGVHDYVWDGNMAIEPGWAIGPRLGAPSASRPPMGFINNGTANRPLTAVTHEVGHLLDLPHAGQNCPAPMGYTKNETGVGAGQQGEYWPSDNRGRLQGTVFHAALAPGRDLARSPIDASVDQGPDPAVPDTKDGDRKAEGPLARLDLMSYCPREGLDATGTYVTNAWLSPRNWNHVFGVMEAFASRPGARAASPRTAVARAAQTGSALAIGSVGPGGGAITRVIPPDPGLATPGADPASPVRIRAYGAGGALLAETGVAVNRNSESSAAGTGTFSAAVPAGADAVELLRDGRTLARSERSRPPVVRLLSPGRRTRVRRGALTVRWSASDPDGGDLRALVQYSADGGRTFRNVASAPAGAGAARIRGAQLEGSRRARVRVAVSDGFNETRVVSRAFTVDGSKPSVEIARPVGGERLRSTGRTLLLGSARDDGMRPLTGRSLRWYAGRRLLGTGARLSARLPAGRQVLRLVARDRQGRTTVARRAVRVAAPKLAFTRVEYERQVRVGARTAIVTVATTTRGTLTAGGRRYAVGPAAKRLRIALPARPARGRLRVPVSVRGSSGGRLTARLTVVRG